MKLLHLRMKAMMAPKMFPVAVGLICSLSWVTASKNSKAFLHDRQNFVALVT